MSPRPVSLSRLQVLEGSRSGRTSGALRGKSINIASLVAGSRHRHRHQSSGVSVSSVLLQCKRRVAPKGYRPALHRTQTVPRQVVGKARPHLDSVIEALGSQQGTPTLVQQLQRSLGRLNQLVLTTGHSRHYDALVGVTGCLKLSSHELMLETGHSSKRYVLHSNGPVHGFLLDQIASGGYTVALYSKLAVRVTPDLYWCLQWKLVPAVH
ncbi:uncharacterized protein KNAG_0L02160 [Huiozyma naganishii CBS 8797]|uniref:Uncharacterized protein n=1 Tax=Huiozyma naganishii (strain ATCC MYA-139 / BCRC 22969 / CBS 8797 / KCTC 17520 / NBRC 10181 / NCYC 3082 / Yp74L-3) TaxID=1071383 RepID=J7RSD6_HUIN7|nr:hypothetical protein KNAG_0L02160 [Kazachstania naganishii CBS 8797]CCK72833.1 hypothetical protein KNAG_0L02160 [Kazachstania naganishii CBS 8797]